MMTQQQQAFTLFELLIAMAIFSLISIMSFSGLNTVMLNKEVIDSELTRLSEIQRSMLHLSRDIEQTISRPIRDELGSTHAAFIGGQNIDSTLFEFSRAGWRNPTYKKRAEIQRVAYSFEDNQLFRIYWQQLDHLSGDEVIRKKLLDDVTQVEVRYFDTDWHTSWPPLTSTVLPTGNITGSIINSDLPVAIEITIELGDWGKITRLFRLPS